MPVNLKDVADALGMDPETVRQILTESPGEKIPKDILDRVFGTARKLGYDFKKLRIGKTMNVRKQIILELLTQIESHPGWGRDEIIKYMHSSCDMVDRVKKRAFTEEFGKPQ
jgi:DNA-binding LacI/PurR family transcriptional regulator